MMFTAPMRTLTLGSALRRAVATNAPLALAGTVFALAFVGTLVGMVVDHRIITGIPAWVKPAKFMISSAIYSFTLVWMLGFVRGHRRLVTAGAWITVVALIVEDMLIALQAARGTTSHFNLSTPLNAAIFSAMGAMTVGLWSGCFLVGVALLLQKLPNPTIAWSLRLGVLLALVGMSIAFFMVTPTAAQMTAAGASGGLPVAGAHTVGRADGGPGLPFLGWSTVAGDLRVAHFIGLHGLQLLPLVAFVVTRRLRRWHAGSQVALVVIAGLAYLGFDLLLAWQALRGQSVIHPDARTLIAAGALVGATAIAVAVVAGREGAAVRTDVASAGMLPRFPPSNDARPARRYALHAARPLFRGAGQP